MRGGRKWKARVGKEEDGMGRDVRKDGEGS
jgi:hypothetical protein